MRSKVVNWKVYRLVLGSIQSNIRKMFPSHKEWTGNQYSAKLLLCIRLSQKARPKTKWMHSKRQDIAAVWCIFCTLLLSPPRLDLLHLQKVGETKLMGRKIKISALVSPSSFCLFPRLPRLPAFICGLQSQCAPKAASFLIIPTYYYYYEELSSQERCLQISIVTYVPLHGRKITKTFHELRLALEFY